MLEALKVQSVDKQKALDVTDSSDYRVIFKSINCITLCLVEELHLVKRMQVKLRPLGAVCVDFDEVFLQLGRLFSRMQTDHVDLNWQGTPLWLADHLY